MDEIKVIELARTPHRFVPARQDQQNRLTLI